MEVTGVRVGGRFTSSRCHDAQIQQTTGHFLFSFSSRCGFGDCGDIFELPDGLLRRIFFHLFFLFFDFIVFFIVVFVVV